MGFCHVTERLWIRLLFRARTQFVLLGPGLAAHRAGSDTYGMRGNSSVFLSPFLSLKAVKKCPWMMKKQTDSKMKEKLRPSQMNLELETGTQANTHTAVLAAAVFTVAQRW